MAIDDQTVPFIMRGIDKSEYFVSTRTVNIIKYLTTLHSDIFCKCLSIESYSISNHEVGLLNYINENHCEYYYGYRKFTSDKDFVVRLDDVIKLYAFLKCCTLKLTHGSSKLCMNMHQFGFIHIYLKSKINSYVPYYMKDGHWCIPVFYLEGHIENLKSHTFELMGWDLMYLKFCCRIQGIRETFYKQDTCMVVQLDNIISYFAPATVFQDYWPSKTIAFSELWHSPTAELLISPNIWFKKPYEFGYEPPVKVTCLSPSSTQETSLTTKQQVMPISPLLPNIPLTNTSLVCIKIFSFNLLLLFKYCIYVLFCIFNLKMLIIVMFYLLWFFRVYQSIKTRSVQAMLIFQPRLALPSLLLCKYRILL